MQISITERHAKVTDAVKEYVHEKANKLLRFHNRISSIEVILDGTNDQGLVEFIVRIEGSDDFVAKNANGDFFAGVDVVIDKLERQITRHKEKHRNRKHIAKNPTKEV